MTTLELARRAGLPPSAVRYYARSGAVRPHRLASGATGYDCADAQRLRALVAVHRARNLHGFALRVDRTE